MLNRKFLKRCFIATACFNKKEVIPNLFRDLTCLMHNLPCVMLKQVQHDGGVKQKSLPIWEAFFISIEDNLYRETLAATAGAAGVRVMEVKTFTV